MTNYTQSGQPHGLKALTQELPKYGRYGDDVVAHISSDEARMLKAMGGSGTINPVTGLPEYFIKKVFAPVQQAWKGITNLPGIKQVSDAVTPLAQQLAPYMPYIAPFIPGVGPLMAAGIGGISAGFGKGQGGFNFKRGLMGGMTAYGLSNLYAGLQSAALSGQTPLPSDVAAASQANSSNVANLATLEAGPQAGMFEAAAQPSMGSNIMAGNFSDAATQFGDKATMMGKDFATQMGNAGEGVKNLIGAGNVPMSEAAKAVGTKFGTGSAAAALTGSMGMAALDEEQKYLDQQKAAGNIADTEYQEAVARIEASRRRGEEAMAANPYRFAIGGQVDDELGGDYSAMGMDQGNMQKGLFGKGYASGGQIKSYAAGGMPDFGNGSTFPNLPPMSGSLGAIGAQQTAQTQPSFAQSPYESSYPYANADTFGQTAQRDYSAQQALGLSGSGLMSMFNQSAQQNTPQMSPNADQNPNTNMGGFAGPRLSYGGAGGSSGGNGGPFPLEGQYGMVKMAAGGMTPRFLSGGGDGMSDSIQATINGKQPARLADGEFVIPADVVSHIGNGSSKAGAKQLYTMMDRARKARTGTTKQAKALNPAKLMPA